MFDDSGPWLSFRLGMTLNRCCVPVLIVVSSVLWLTLCSVVTAVVILSRAAGLPCRL